MTKNTPLTEKFKKLWKVTKSMNTLEHKDVKVSLTGFHKKVAGLKLYNELIPLSKVMISTRAFRRVPHTNCCSIESVQW